jgi:tetratricopeptide (TPR) repeat protein
MLALAGGGCSRVRKIAGPEVVFPRLDSARQQFYYAAQFDEQTLVGKGPEKGEERLRRIIAAYQTVLDHFPDDQLFAPLAQAAIGNCYFRMKDYRKTIQVFKRLQDRYPNYPFIHAEAEWKIGRSYDLLGNSSQAKRHYKRCIDTFGRSKNDQIQAIVSMCKQFYIQPSVPGRPTKG